MPPSAFRPAALQAVRLRRAPLDRYEKQNPLRLQKKSNPWRIHLESTASEGPAQLETPAMRPFPRRAAQNRRPDHGLRRKPRTSTRPGGPPPPGAIQQNSGEAQPKERGIRALAPLRKMSFDPTCPSRFREEAIQREQRHLGPGRGVKPSGWPVDGPPRIIYPRSSGIMPSKMLRNGLWSRSGASRIRCRSSVTTLSSWGPALPE